MIPLSTLTVENSIPTGSTVLISRPDSTNPSLQIPDRLSIAALLAGVSGGSGGAGVSTIEVAALNLTIPASTVKDTTLGTLLYQITNVNDVSNLLLLGIEIQYQDVIGSKFTYDLWAGDPTAPGSQLLASAGQDIFFTAVSNSFSSSSAAYLSNADLRTGLWINVTNRLTSPLKFSAKLTFAQFLPPSAPVTLPTYTYTPFVYTGPSNLSVVDVGPGQTFPEMADAMPYVAPGFNMRVHAGQYFKPFRVPQGFDGFIIQAAAGVAAEDIVCNGRGGWVSGLPLWTDNGSAIGDAPRNPFRLSQGKGFILVSSPGTIRSLGFWYCGGGYGISLDKAPDNIGDGEAGIYPELFANLGDIHVERCIFNGNENGIFSPAATGSGANVRLYIDRCDFSNVTANGVTPDGASHNIYVNCKEVHITNSNFFGCKGNSLKSRSPTLTIDNCFLEADAGRCIDYPSGGSLTVTNSKLSQNFTNGNYPQHNYLSFAVEDTSNGPADAHFTDCQLHIGRGDTVIRIAGNSTVVFSNCPYTWYTAADPTGAPSFTYDGAQSTTGVSGIVFPATSSSGGTVVASGIPPRPSILAHLS